jgi:hypothetical protein
MHVSDATDGFKAVRVHRHAQSRANVGVNLVHRCLQSTTDVFPRAACRSRIGEQRARGLGARFVGEKQGTLRRAVGIHPAAGRKHDTQYSERWWLSG